MVAALPFSRHTIELRIHILLAACSSESRTHSRFQLSQARAEAPQEIQCQLGIRCATIEGMMYRKRSTALTYRMLR
ncbi:hypothetical protein WL88_29035 [Burkholderia diffusa]|uniref:Uncharacterized protein n=1 Tax=Burkholderia diffusa TaxID=488732 RepID=A0AAW3P7H0_9BURK|nr:hypothetical protein WL85_00230 [Burkholderia diffusa]KWF44216.1 hypothetical protein WL86_08665 [Burkholderia diffusa]KWF45124.1 hypothetical protein WL88_29035 [Burkholderia diffusa]KWF51107.1 hypothetical protein WL87_14680 [Burkholderia diffusa]